MATTSKTFTTPQATQTHYLQSGNPDGPLIVCMHGLGGSSATTVIVEFPGYGKTPRNASLSITIAGLVNNLHHFIEHLQLEAGAERKVVILGRSLGTIVGMHYAARLPDKVDGMLLPGAGRSASHIPVVRQRMLDIETRARTEGIEAVASSASVGNFPSDGQRPVPAENRQTVYNEVAAADVEAYAQTCEAIVGIEHEDPLYGVIRCPVLFVAGDMDMISPIEPSEGLSTLFGGKCSVQVVKSGHRPIIDDLGSVLKAMKKLLEQTSSAV